MENPIYRITVEVIGDEKEHELGDSLRGGVECDGFAIIANKGKGGTTAIHAISNIDLAAIIAGSDEMMAASVIAKALREALDITADKPAKILAGILGGIGK